MRKHRLVIHIGGSKCGSSAIQKFLGMNADKLATKNVIVPSVNLLKDQNVTGEQIWFFENIKSEGATGIERFQNRLKLLGSEHKKTKTIILSAENLSNPLGFEDIFKGLEEIFDVQIICYIRRQDDYLMSAWQQWFMKSSPDFWSWAITQVGIRANWQNVLEPWLGTFGKENLRVRVFERPKLIGHDIITDFCDLIGASSEGLELNLGTINPSYNNAVQDVIENANFLFDGIHDNRVYEMIGSLTGSRHYKRSGEVFLSSDQRKSIIEKYSDSNEWVRQTFLPDLPQNELFSLSSLDEKTPVTRDRTQEKDAFIFDLIFQLHRKIGALDANLRKHAEESASKQPTPEVKPKRPPATPKSKATTQKKNNQKNNTEEGIR